MGITDWFRSDSGSSSSPKLARQPSKTEQVWHSTFHPGANHPQNMEKVGRDYYDHVQDKDRAPSMWDMILKSQALHTTSFSQVDRDGDGRISHTELAAVLEPAGFDACAAQRAMDEANASKEGLSKKQWEDMMSRHFGAT